MTRTPSSAAAAANQSSILTTAVLADLGVADIWAKALDRQYAKFLERIGASHVFQPEHEMGERVAHLLSGQMHRTTSKSTRTGPSSNAPPRFLVGVPLGESGLRAKYHVTIVSVKHEEKDEFTYADAATTLRYGDQTLVVGKVRHVERFVDEI
jgi:trk system potassium uptake protein TrkA